MWVRLPHLPFYPGTYMILLLGDIHGDVSRLRYGVQQATEAGAVALVQVGDLGLFPSHGRDTGFHAVCKASSIPIYFIEGNHDDCTRWVKLTEVTRVWDDANLFYVPRGTVMELDGRTIAFMGGAISVCKAHFDDSAKLWFGVGKDWHDVNMEVIQRIWDRLDNPMIYSGHMHRTVIGPNYRILNINELLAI